MTRHFFKLLMTSAALAGIAATAVPAQASGPKDSAVSADRYGYVFHASRFDVYSDGARLDPAAVPAMGADVSRLRKPDPFSDGAQKLAGMDRSGVSSDPARKVDPFQDGAQKLAGMDRSGPSADPGRKFDTYQDGAHA
ncbi:copper resistance protein CopQ [Cupriavidus sp. CV2]|uniref:copper resistance protein CopQ n=1 Tax=Cupriavidus ulmosensis TaxID=3065913 RepID=UPI00296AAB14|nr:copper resistance protein CopQ [Cupriavidus sp. CV2]MDW3687488.1 copper resistance protein CopQ [Cupriavidus sp. CV2]